MIALKKKRQEAAARAKAEAEAQGPPSSEPTNTPTAQISLIGGISGVKTRKSKAGSQGGKKKTPCEIRLQKDIAGLSDFDGIATVKFSDPNNLTSFDVFITPNEGYWRRARYRFAFSVPTDYPHKPPKVICHTKIYHPNIDLEGNICINILREDWKPVLDINTVIHGLSFLFSYPNPDDPLNKEAANLLRNDEHSFATLVSRSLRGGRIQGEYFEALL